MVTNPACFAHSAGRYDYLRGSVRIEHLRILSVPGKFQILEIQRIISAEYILLSLLVEYLSVSLKHFGGCSRHGTVDIHIYILQLFLIFRVLLIEHIELIY